MLLLLRGDSGGHVRRYLSNALQARPEMAIRFVVNVDGVDAVREES